MATHVMTPARKAALRKAQLASAAKRRRVTVYHYTTPRKAKKIIKQQQFKPSRLAPGNKKNAIYFTRRRSNFYQHEFNPAWRKTAVVQTKVAAGHLKRDPNDEWFQKSLTVKAAKHKPANAYMADRHHVHSKITLAQTKSKVVHGKRVR